MSFTRKAVFILIISATLFKAKSVTGQTPPLQAVTGAGNTTTNPITIGSSNAPSAWLEIFHNGNATYGTALQLKTTGGVDGPRAAFEIYNGGNPKRWNIGIRNSATSFGLYEDGWVGGFGTERFTLLPGGRLGLNNTNPIDALDINSPNFRAVNINEAFDFFNSATKSFINFGINARGTNAQALANAGALYGIKLTAQKQLPTSNSLENKTVVYGLASEDWAGYTRKVGAAIYTSDMDQTAVERMRITGSGNVGIGTSNPSGKLHVVGEHTTTQFRLTFPSVLNGGGTGDVNLQAWASEPSVTWDAGGIGTNVTNDGGANGFGRPNLNLGQSFIRFITNGGAMQFNTTANNGTFYGNTLFMSNGNVGIGTSNLSAKLSVAAKVSDQSAITIGYAGDAGSAVSAGQIAGGYNIDFQGYRDIVQNQIGARIRGERISVYDGAKMQAMDLAFYTSTGADASKLTEKFRIKSSGNVGIGITDPQQKLHVDGNIHTTGKMIIGAVDYAKIANYALAVKGTAIAEKMVVQTYPTWPDYVFHSNYKLRSLSSLKTYINTNKHLPDVPSQKEVEKGGLDIGSTQAVLLRKIEELTLYVIAQDEKSKQQQKLLELMTDEIQQLKKQPLLSK